MHFMAVSFLCQGLWGCTDEVTDMWSNCLQWDHAILFPKGKLLRSDVPRCCNHYKIAWVFMPIEKTACKHGIPPIARFVANYSKASAPLRPICRLSIWAHEKSCGKSWSLLKTFRQTQCLIGSAKFGANGFCLCVCVLQWIYFVWSQNINHVLQSFCTELQKSLNEVSQNQKLVISQCEKKEEENNSNVEKRRCW